jgi:Domain of unknown function (DUF4129)
VGVIHLLGTLGRVLADIPVDPDGPEAKHLVVNELSKQEYQNARPSLFDLVAKAIFDWFGSLRIGGIEGAPSFGILIVLAIFATIVVIAILVFGVPRMNRRSKLPGELFGEDDNRSAAQIRAAAQSAAARGDYVAAIAEMFRSIARGLAERTIVSTNPGTTARAFAVKAGIAFPESAGELSASAASFDRVRYLGKPGSAAEYEQVSRLESQLRNSKAILTDAVPA